MENNFLFFLHENAVCVTHRTPVKLLNEKIEPSDCFLGLRYGKI